MARVEGAHPPAGGTGNEMKATDIAKHIVFALTWGLVLGVFAALILVLLAPEACATAQPFSWTVPGAARSVKIYLVEDGKRPRALSWTKRPMSEYCRLDVRARAWQCEFRGDYGRTYEFKFYDAVGDRLVWADWEVLRCEWSATDTSGNPAWVCSYEREGS